MELDLLNKLVVMWPPAGTILMILGSMLVVAQIIVLMTPSPKDNEFMAKLEVVPVLGGFLRVIRSFAPFQKK